MFVSGFDGWWALSEEVDGKSVARALFLYYADAKSFEARCVLMEPSRTYALTLIQEDDDGT